MEPKITKSREYAAIAAFVAAALALLGLEPQANQSVGEYLVALVASIF